MLRGAAAVVLAAVLAAPVPAAARSVSKPQKEACLRGETRAEVLAAAEDLKLGKRAGTRNQEILVSVLGRPSIPLEDWAQRDGPGFAVACLEALGRAATPPPGSLERTASRIADELSEEDGWFVPELRAGDLGAFVFGIVGVLAGAWLASSAQRRLQQEQWVEERRRQLLDDAANVAALTTGYGKLYDAKGGVGEDVDQAKAEAEAALAKLRGRLNVVWGEGAATAELEDLAQALDENDTNRMKNSAAALRTIIRELPEPPALPTAA